MNVVSNNYQTVEINHASQIKSSCMIQINRRTFSMTVLILNIPQSFARHPQQVWDSSHLLCIGTHVNELSGFGRREAGVKGISSPTHPTTHAIG
jgi:hypothetical protein